MKSLLGFIITINLSLVFGQQTVDFKINTVDSLEIQTLKFYVSNFKITTVDGSYFSNKDNYLVDISDSSTFTLTFPIDANQQISSVEFNIGTDSITNVSADFTHDLSPLKEMYWAWNSGYINFKFEGQYKTRMIEYHIGGYLPPFQTCRTVHLDMKDSNIIAVDLKTLLASAELSQMNSVLIPGKNAAIIADKLPLIFN